jgi:hypothetical protein
LILDTAFQISRIHCFRMHAVQINAGIRFHPCPQPNIKTYFSLRHMHETCLLISLQSRCIQIHPNTAAASHPASLAWEGQAGSMELHTRLQFRSGQIFIPVCLLVTDFFLIFLFVRVVLTLLLQNSSSVLFRTRLLS